MTNHLLGGNARKVLKGIFRAFVFCGVAAACHADGGGEWIEWAEGSDGLAESQISLRGLNERAAGEAGWVSVRGGRFVLGDGKPVRFWAVNGPPGAVKADDLKALARQLAARGVNLVRFHGSVFDGKTGQFKPEIVPRLHEIIDAMKAEGIYTHLSIYFPLWMKPGAAFLEGYDGEKHPFAALMFNKCFQEIYQGWWKEILTSRPPGSARPLLDEPALFGVEIQNEDSFFFWTFNKDNLPAPQWQKLEAMFYDWAVKRHGSAAAALKAWDGLRLPDDTDGRFGFRPLYDIFTHRTPRDRDTAEFLFETQDRFYRDQVAFLRQLGFKGLITASNWTTANNRILGPLEKLSYLSGDFIDRHGYFAGQHEGPDAAWSVKPGQVFSHRSALRFDPRKPGEPPEVSHPAFDTKIGDKPSMISETTYNRPNRHRVEAPAYFAIYGALQGSDAIVHFALDGHRWDVKPNFWMQPWTLMSPTQIGQFPAAALIYRQGLVKEGDLMADIHLRRADVLALQGTPLAESSNLDELRKADLTGPSSGPSTSAIDPVIHLIGRTRLTISEEEKPSRVSDLRPFLDRVKSLVRSSTGEVVLDYGRGFLTLDAPAAQGAVGDLSKAGTIQTAAAKFSSGLDAVAILLVAMDGKPLASSSRMLLQVMSEEQTTGFTTEPAGKGTHRIIEIGKNPWRIRPIQGQLELLRPDASHLHTTPFDASGRPAGEPSMGARIPFAPGVAYYLIEAKTKE